jgi:hypothetical protein
MLYALYNPDGSIHQANKVYDHEGDDERGKKSYDGLLSDLGHKFVKVANAPGLLPPDHYFVDVTAEEIRERPMMGAIEVNKTRIICGDQDSCLITGIPKKATARVTMRDGTEVYPPFVLDAEQLEISIPVPCVYRVWLDLWPYKTFTVDIEAVAS